jgi:phosphoglycerate dehydrogenase-like enzyme
MKKKVLIETNPHFTKSSWENFLREHYPEFSTKYNIQFVSNRQELELFIQSANYCFTFQIPDIKLITNIHLLYLGISDIDYLDSYTIPENINIFTSKGLASNLIAEHTLLLALSLIRKLNVAVYNQTRKKWDQIPYIEDGMKSIKDYRIGVLGLGNNGRAIVELFKGLGCWVAGYSNDSDEGENLDIWYPIDKLNDFIVDCDIIIISVPLRKQTYHLIDQEQFNLMKNSTYLINVARGEIINEAALYFSLKNNLIKGAAIDVFNKEPLYKKSKLWKLSNIIITPHIAGNIHFFIEHIQKDFILHIDKYA